MIQAPQGKKELSQEQIMASISEMVELRDLKPNDRNPRYIKEDSFAKLKKSIEEFPEMLSARPIIANREGLILGGTQRFRALKALKITKTPVIYVDWSEEKQREFIVKDNISNGEWDWDILAEEYTIDELQNWDLEVLPDAFVDASSAEEIVEPDTPEVAEDSESKEGEIYRLGENHILICGSSSDRELHEKAKKLLGVEQYDIINTDPPYGMNYKRDNDKENAIMNDSANDIPTIVKDCFEATLESLRPDGAIYAWHSLRYQDEMLKVYQDEMMLTIKDDIIWNKGFTFRRSDYHLNYEACYYMFGQKQPRWFGAENLGDVFERGEINLKDLKLEEAKKIIENALNNTQVWDIEKEKVQNYQHPTQKPVKLAGKAIENSTEWGDTVVDIFAGSGFTMLACEQLGRKSVSFELDPRFVDVIRKRWAILKNGNDQDWQEYTKPEAK